MKATHYLLAFVFSLLGFAAFGTITHRTYPLNPNVYQTDIGSTICVKGWTATVRPSTSYTGPIKANLCLEQQCSHPENYELDHFIPIELGGAPDDPANLWLQPFPEARHKDAVENYLKRQVCTKGLTLQQAQAKMYNWKSVYAQMTNKFGSVQSVDDTDVDDNQ